MAGLDPAIHDDSPSKKSHVSFPAWHGIMDARVKPAHDKVCFRMIYHIPRTRGPIGRAGGAT
jgi:hypothetical protein